MNQNININDAPPATPEPEIEINDLYYNCSECPSLIEILSINEDNNIIEFKCLNKDKEHNHEKKIIPIKEYLLKMENYRKKNINDKCEEHSCKYVSYCLDCNCHLCEECLKSRSHINHNKNNIIEIKPMKEELLIIEEIIKDYNIKIENLKNEKINKEKELKNTLNKNKEDEKKRIKEKIKIINNEKDEELKLNKEEFISDIEEIKKRYKKEIKERREKYEKKINEINNKYKLKNNKENIVYEFKIEKLDKEYNEKIKNFKYDIKIEDMTNLKKINEIVYNTYNVCNDNYYNSVNINNILLSYYKNEYIKNKIMKRILNNNYEEILKIILKKREEERNINIGKKKEKNNLKIEEIKEEYNKKIKEIIDEKEKEIKKLKEIRENQMKEYENKIKEKEEIFKRETELLKKNISYLYI